MKFTIRWIPSAERELAESWLAAPDRNAVTAAAYAIERLLEVDPLRAGESRPNGRRILLEPPLGVLFEVDSKREVVRVVKVWHFERRTSR